MRYKYKCDNEIIEVWMWDNEFHNKVEVKDRKTSKFYERTIREDENGKFFTWNKHKIHLHDWVRVSLEELKKKIEHGEWVTSDDLCQAILTDGIDNARFIVPLNTVCGDGNKFKDTLCKVEERCNREVKQNYKLTLVSVEPDNDVESYCDCYTTDMISLIKSGHIKIVA